MFGHRISFILFLAIFLSPVPTVFAETMTLTTGGATFEEDIQLSFGTSSTATLKDVVVTDSWNVGTTMVINTDTTPPAYILNTIYVYDADNTQITVYSRDSTSFDLDFSSEISDTDVKVYGSGTSAYVTESPSWDILNKELTIKMDSTGSELTIYVGTQGKPTLVNVDGSDVLEDSGWTFASDIVTLTSGGLVNEFRFSGSSSGASSGASGGGGGGGAIVGSIGDTTVSDIPSVTTTVSQVTEPRLLTTGSLIIVSVLIGGIFIAQQRRSSSLGKLFGAKQQKSKKALKNKPKYKKPKYK